MALGERGRRAVRAARCRMARQRRRTCGSDAGVRRDPRVRRPGGGRPAAPPERAPAGRVWRAADVPIAASLALLLGRTTGAVMTDAATEALRRRLDALARARL